MELFERAWTFMFVFLSWVSLDVIPIFACPTECNCVALVTQCTVTTTWLKIPDDIPTTSTSLTIECKLTGNIKSLDNLGRLTAVKELSITNCGLTSVRTSHIRPMRGLRKLVLKANQIKSIEINTFIQLSELTEFDIESNNLTHLPNRIFVEQKKLLRINMNNNQLQTIGAEYFVGLANLKTLKLRQNDIQSISPGSLNLPNVDDMDIGHNNLKEIRSKDFAGMAKVNELNLHGNTIEKIGIGAFKIPSLQTLYLSNNKIRTINPDAYSTNLKALYLHDNLIQIIDEKARNDFFPHLNNLTLGGNPLHCNCRMKWLKIYHDSNTKLFESKFPMPTESAYPRCHTPITGRLTHVNMTDFTCVSATFTEISGGKVGPVCKGNGDPVPVITWKDPSGQVVKIHQPHVNKSDLNAIGELRLKSDMESGTYTCIVSNFQQAQNSSLHVQIFKADMPTTEPCTTATTTTVKSASLNTPVQFPLYIFIIAIAGSVVGTALLLGLICACCACARKGSGRQESTREAKRATNNSSLNRADFVRQPRSDPESNPGNVYETLKKDEYLEPKELGGSQTLDSNFKSMERNIFMGPERDVPVITDHNSYNFNRTGPDFQSLDKNPRVSRGTVVSLTSNMN